MEVGRGGEGEGQLLLGLFVHSLEKGLWNRGFLLGGAGIFNPSIQSDKNNKTHAGRLPEIYKLIG